MGFFKNILGLFSNKSPAHAPKLIKLPPVEVAVPTLIVKSDRVHIISAEASKLSPGVSLNESVPYINIPSAGKLNVKTPIVEPVVPPKEKKTRAIKPSVKVGMGVKEIEISDVPTSNIAKLAKKPRKTAKRS